MSSYRQIFKSSALFGGTQVLTILASVIRTKCLAVLLGPSGVGIAGMYQSATGVIGTLAGLGIRRAGVRQIAEALGSGDEERIAVTGRSLRYVSLASGLLGMLVVLLFCGPLSRATFGNGNFTWGVATVSLVLLCDQISAGQAALLQGMRRLRELAVCQVSGTLFGTVASMAIIYLYGVGAVAWYMVAISAFGILTSWWYARKIPLKEVAVSASSLVREARALVGIGVAFMVSGLVGTGTIYLSRVLVIRQFGMDAVGLYTAVITLSTIYVNMILQAMSTDYYPRLSAVAHDHEQVNRMVNEQTEMGLLLALPGVLATISLASWVLQIFYSKAFAPAAGVIQWQILGVALCVVSWPMGIIMPAKGMSRALVWSEVVVAAVHLALLYAGMKLWGLEGVGISFLLKYLFHTCLAYAIARRATGFRWSRRALVITSASCCASIAVFLLVRLLPGASGSYAGVTLTAAATGASFLVLKQMLGFKMLRRGPAAPAAAQVSADE